MSFMTFQNILTPFIQHLPRPISASNFQPAEALYRISIDLMLCAFGSCFGVVPSEQYEYLHGVSSTRCRQDEIISLKVGGNGFIDLKITKPIRRTHFNNILVKFPPGPLPGAREPEQALFESATQLSKSFHDATIVDVQYRLRPGPRPQDAQPEPDHRFPTPVHDVFTAWDYITGELASQNTTLEGSKICLCGSHIGGALALTLALTNPSLVHAVVVENPLVDWVILDELAAYSTENSKANISTQKTARHDSREATAASARALVQLRTSLFRTPSGYFDHFASPILFLRAPGRDTPLTKTAAPVDTGPRFVEGTPMRYGEEDDEVGIVEYDGRPDFGPYDDDWHAIETKRIREQEYRHDTVSSNATSTPTGSQQSASSGDQHSASAGSSTASSPQDVTPRRRKVLRRWPPNAQPEDVTLPQINIFLTRPAPSRVGDHDRYQTADITPVTWPQGMELAELLRRACFWGRDQTFADERVVVSEHDPAAPHLERQDQVIRWLQAKFDEKTLMRTCSPLTSDTV
ncbi:hypothetical protein LTR70_000543 [Exophiala xenobiotica]|uniref:Alpha/beta hydrolase fold-3 domain-containing protein n=1 Tax=Lithohypha guttulata TaxID=1690604 RepID=A0ABR0KB67_9EURO|nr:hypothetical protein LTR24_004649 [Lithohypha guttulata]KAK5329394.1 hypothetical protein LTR70_000543 [Exophiala xenobiotica]